MSCVRLFRCAERLVLGDANITTAGAADLEQANNIAHEMVRRALLYPPAGIIPSFREYSLVLEQRLGSSEC
jgi:ATP-dependent Zn protease